MGEWQQAAPWAMVVIAGLGYIVQVAISVKATRDLNEWRKGQPDPSRLEALEEWRKDKVDPFIERSLEMRGRVTQQLKDLSRRLGADHDESRYD